MADKYSLEDFFEAKELPDYNLLFSLFNEASELLETEVTDYRPSAKDGSYGGLIEFSDDVPVIVVPDIHGRPGFIRNLLNFVIPDTYKTPAGGLSVLQALEQSLVYVVCVGDAIHTERTRERWIEIQSEYEQGIFDGEAMKAEMSVSLCTLCALIELKKRFKSNFFFLKGNHENILNGFDNGNCAFGKYAEEGSIVKDFIRVTYGDDILYLISCYENALPLVFKNKNCIVTHAEPAVIFDRDDAINAWSNPELIYGVTWTKNDQVETKTVEAIFKKFLSKKDIKKAIYLGGHRPVRGNFSLRQDGKYVQIHNPARQNIAIVCSHRKFNPEQDIFGVEK